MSGANSTRNGDGASLGSDVVAKRYDSSAAVREFGRSVVPARTGVVCYRPGRGVRGPGNQRVAGGWLASLVFPREVVLIRSGNFDVRVAVDGVRCVDDIELAVSFDLSVEVADEALFVEQVLGTAKVATREDLASALTGPARQALIERFGSRASEEVVSEPSAVSETLATWLADWLGVRGLEPVLGSVDVRAPSLDRVRARRAEVHTESELGALDDRSEAGAAALDARRVERARDREVGSIEAKDDVRQAHHESDLKDVIREGELRDRQAALDEARKTRTHEEEIQRGALDFDEQMRQRRELQGQEIDELRKKHELADEARAATIRADAERKRHLADHERARAQTLAGLDLVTLIALGNENADRLERLEELRERSAMNPEQLLAMAAERSPTAAAALLRRAELDVSQPEKVISLLREQLDHERLANTAQVETLERVLRDALEQMRRTGETRIL